MDSWSCRPARIPTRKASSPPCTAGNLTGHELHRSSHSWTAKPARPPRPAVARFAHLGDGPLQLSLSVLHAERAISRALSILEVPGAAVVRGNRAARAAVRHLGRAQAAPHRRRTPAAHESRGFGGRTHRYSR